MSTVPKNIFVIDDESHAMYGEVLRRIFPETAVSNFSAVEPALAKMEEGVYPDLMFLDATGLGWHTEWGADNAQEILMWMQNQVPQQPLPDIIFQSNDHNLAEKAIRIVRRRVGATQNPFKMISTDKGELSLVRDIFAAKEGGRVHLSSDVGWTALREFLNQKYGLGLPETQEEIDELVFSQEAIDPEGLLRMERNGALPREDVLKRLASEIPSQASYEYHSRIFPGENYETANAMAIAFQRGTGSPVKGPAIFRAEDIAPYVKEGQKPIFITQDVTPEIVQLFNHVGAIIVLSNKASGHAEVLAQAHRIPALLGKIDHYRGPKSRVRLDVIGKEPKLSIHTKTNLWNGKVKPDALISWGIEEIKLLRSELEEESQGEPSELSSKHDYSHKLKIVIRTGNEVTVDPETDRLFALPLSIQDQEHRSHSWLPSARRLLESWHEDNGIPLLKFKHNIDILEQRYTGASSSGIGLVRTEHLVISVPQALEAFRQTVLQQNPKALEIFEQHQEQDFYEILEVLSGTVDYPVRIRLIDAPPSEFFDAQALDAIETLYGDRKIRGVQLAQKVSQIYEAQIRAIFSVHKRLQEKAKADDYYNMPGPVEIMVPTVRTAEELTAVKNQVERMAAELEVAKEDYRFGSMLETADACKNIVAIAELCDFISIGSNDLTSELLNCDRDDWTKRRKLTVDSGKGEDPFITIHVKVLKALVSAVKQARMSNPSLQVDLCGAHAADLQSLNALRPLALSGVSAPPSPQNQDKLSLLYMLDTFQAYTDKPKKVPRASRKTAATVAPRRI